MSGPASIPYSVPAERRAYVDGWLTRDRNGSDAVAAEQTDECQKAIDLGCESAFWTGYFDRNNRRD